MPQHVVPKKSQKKKINVRQQNIWKRHRIWNLRRSADAATLCLKEKALINNNKPASSQRKGGFGFLVILQLIFLQKPFQRLITTERSRTASAALCITSCGFSLASGCISSRGVSINFLFIFCIASEKFGAVFPSAVISQSNASSPSSPSTRKAVLKRKHRLTYWYKHRT